MRRAHQPIGQLALPFRAPEPTTYSSGPVDHAVLEQDALHARVSHLRCITVSVLCTSERAFAWVSRRMAADVDAHTWRLDRAGYPRTTINGRATYLHALVFGPVPDGKVIDHIDRNPLNCTDENLRALTPSESNVNRRRPRRPRPYSSRYRGVTLFRLANGRTKWQAFYHANHKPVHLGLFESETAAAIAWNRAQRKEWGPHLYVRNHIPVRRTTTTVWARDGEHRRTHTLRAA